MRQIASRDNPHFKALKKLCQNGRERRKTGRVVLDGIHLIESYVQRFGSPEEIVVSRSGLGHTEIARYIESNAAEIAVSVVDDSLFDELASVETPSGIIAVIEQPHSQYGLNLQADAVLLDGIQDPGNLGSILRSAGAAGFRQILLSADCAHAWSPKVLRAAMGAHFLVDIHERCDLPSFLGGYQGQSISTELNAADSLYAASFGSPIAWVFGSEGQGVRPHVAAAVSSRIVIPMPGQAESLNVAAAAAICLFETVRRRLQ
ncbi:MAG: RNA methyltransferase [Propionivibrio sp.]